MSTGAITKPKFALLGGVRRTYQCWVTRDWPPMRQNNRAHVVKGSDTPMKGASVPSCAALSVPRLVCDRLGAATSRQRPSN